MRISMLAFGVGALLVGGGLSACGGGSSGSASSSGASSSGGLASSSATASPGGASALAAEAKSKATGDIPDSQVFLTFRNPGRILDAVSGGLGTARRGR